MATATTRKHPLAKCEECPLQHTKGYIEGTSVNPDPKFAVVGHAPGPSELAQGRPFVGRNGTLCNWHISEAGHHPDDVWFTNLVACRSTDTMGRDVPPPPAAVRACRPRFEAEMDALEAPVVVTTGDTTARVLTNDAGSVSKVEGTLFYNGVLAKYVLPTFQPLYAERGGGEMATASLVDAFKRAALYQTRPDLLPDVQAEPTFEYCRTPEDTVTSLRQLLANPGAYALDTETAYAGDPTYEMIMVQIGTRDQAWCFDVEQLMEGEGEQLFRELMSSDVHEWVLHNLPFDFQHFWHWWSLTPKHAHDTMAMALCLTEQSAHVSLKYLARRHLNAGFYEADVNENKIGPDNPMTKIDRPTLAKYGAWDVIYTRQLFDLMLALIADNGNHQLYNDILLPAQKTFWQMQYHGVLVNTDQIAQVERELNDALAPKIAEVQGVADEYGFDPTTILKGKPKSPKYNPNSDPQRKHLFYDLMGLDRVYDKGKVTTGKEFYKAHPNAPGVLLSKEITHIQKMKSTYATGFRKFVWPTDSRVHPSYLLAGARTGRIAVIDPPMQTIPHDSTVGSDFPSIKTMFDAPPGYVFVEADYSALELYIMYELSRDPTIIKELLEGDFHIKAAADAFRVLRGAVTDKQRTDGKRVTYGIAYNITEVGLQQQIGGTLEENADRIAGWLEGFPIFAQWRDQIQAQAIEERYLETRTGRKRRWSLVTPDNEHGVRSQASNFPIQSLANDLCMMSLVEVNQALRAEGLGYVVLTVHDSIEAEVREDRVDEACQLIADIMMRPKFETVFNYHPVEVKVGPNWGSTKVHPIKEPKGGVLHVAS